MTKRTVVAIALFFVIAVPLHADFSAIARAIDDQSGVKRVWIPFLGLARVVVRVVQPEGVHDFQLATFEGADDLDPHWLREVLRTQAGPGFTPLVQTWSRKGKEWSFIYARPTAQTNRLELMILTHDSDDTVLVRVAVDADVVARELKDKPRTVSVHVAGR
jgi:hypothetical protein